MLVRHIGDVVCEALDELDSFVVNGHTLKDEGVVGEIGHLFDKSPKPKGFTEEFMSLEEEILGIYQSKLYGIGVQKSELSSTGSFAEESSPTVEEETV
ncbi:unnamed protein product, partial [Ilex paraguariensis]